MKWVLLFFCTIFLIILFILIILSLCTIKLNIKRLYISNYENNTKNKINKEIIIFLEIFLLGKLKIAKFRLNQNLFSNMDLKTDIKTLRKNLKRIKEINIFDMVKKLKVQVEMAYLNTEIGTKDIISTIFLVTCISSIARNTI